MKKILYLIVSLIAIYFVVLIHLTLIENIGSTADELTIDSLPDALFIAGMFSIFPIVLAILICYTIHES